jgi:hypothetical protein
LSRLILLYPVSADWLVPVSLKGHGFSSRSLIFPLSINRSDWLTRLATDRESRVLRAEVMSYFRINTLLARPVGPEKVNNEEAYEDWSS